MLHKHSMLVSEKCDLILVEHDEVGRWIVFKENEQAQSTFTTIIRLLLPFHTKLTCDGEQPALKYLFPGLFSTLKIPTLHNVLFRKSTRWKENGIYEFELLLLLQLLVNVENLKMENVCA